jgi:subtilisin family serine protease
VNSKGEIHFARFSYTNEFLDMTVDQWATPELQKGSVLSQAVTSQKDESGEVLALHEQESDKNQPVSNIWPELSLATAQESVGIQQLRNEMNVSGRGVTIAVIDSGIDSLQQDLQRTQDGQRKIVDWVNFSQEGRVETNMLAFAAADGKSIHTSQGIYTLPSTERSQSGQYHYGFWAEKWITYLHDFDFTGNSSNQDQVMVLVIDSKTAGNYDQVFVDTNHNYSLADEVPLMVYRENKFNYASFPKPNNLPQGFPFVLCDIWNGGNAVSFGYDSEGHGTHIAGIAAANGKLQGVAPDAQLIALKVADSAGIAYLEDTLRAVEYAVQKGANIINLSLGYYEQDEEAIRNFRSRIDELADHTLICVAAGNNGPGLSTLMVPADAPHTLTVGAFIDPGMSHTDYGWTVGAAVPWYFSSAGPARDGSLKPDLLAPGSVISTVPVWTGKSAQLIEGSSMAAPFVAGTAALLMEELWEQGLGFNSLMIKQALVQGARAMDGLSAAEQGHGVLDALAANRIVLEEKVLPDDSEVRVSSDLVGDGTGLMIRQSIPGRASFVIQNRDREAQVVWQSKSDWLQLENAPVYLPSGSQRDLQVKYDLPAQAGLYSGLIEGAFVDSNRAPLEILNTVIVPEPWSINGEINSYNDLAAGQMQRIYIRVPEEQEALQLQLRVLGSLSNLQGRARMHVFDAAGQLYSVSEFAGQAPQGLTAQREISEKIDHPIAGIWEIVIYSSSTLSDFGLARSDYVFHAKLARPVNAPSLIENEFIIGSAHPRTADRSADIWLTVLNVSDQLPYTGLLQINDRLYYVNQGKVRVTTAIQRDSVNLVVKKIQE